MAEPEWEEYIADIESIEGALDVQPDEEKNRIALEYDGTESQFHQRTTYDYEILDFSMPLMMVTPAD